jgi:hypothetical protein
MLIDHTAVLLLPPEKYPTLTILYVIMRTIGRIAAPVMFYFLVEGYIHTSSRMKYIIRLLSFGIFSQVPYSLVRYREMSWDNLNVMFTLFMSFAMMVIVDKVENKVLRGIVVSTIMFLTVFSDWGVMGPFMVWLFYIYHEDRKKQLISYISLSLAQILMSIFMMISGALVWYESIWQIGMILPVILIYPYNGEAGRKNIINKWSFYLFYPLHFVFLWLVMHNNESLL